MKKLLSILFVLCLIPMISGCDTIKPKSTQNNQNENTRFKQVYSQVIVDGNATDVILDKETGVEYLIIVSRYGYGITPLYNTDGSLKVNDEWNRKANENVD